MTRKELKEIIVKVINKLQKKAETAPTPACLYNDGLCDVTTKYGINEEG